MSNGSLLFSLETAIMSDFIESEAEESEEEFEEKDLKPKKTQRFMEEDGEIGVVLDLGSMMWLFGMWITNLSFC